MKQVSELSDNELSELFAVEFAGWEKTNGSWQDADGYIVWNHDRDEEADPSFATNVNAVLPFVDAIGDIGTMVLFEEAFGDEFFFGENPANKLNLPRCACIALLKMNNITEVES